MKQVNKISFVLYKAIKEQLENYPNDKGLTLLEAWKFVNSHTPEGDDARETLLEDYMLPNGSFQTL